MTDFRSLKINNSLGNGQTTMVLKTGADRLITVWSNPVNWTRKKEVESELDESAGSFQPNNSIYFILFYSQHQNNVVLMTI